jgi:hypothetical protein
MSKPVSPFEVDPPSRKQLVTSILAAVAGAALILVAFVLPAEYAIDPSGIGKTLGLTAMHAPTRTLQIKDVIGGNEAYREVKIPDPRDPIPLPNPAVVQIKQSAPRSETKTIKLEPGQQTEIKAIMDAAQVIVYSWKAEGGEVYTDFHGHEPEGGESFVRYEEQQSGAEGHGSLVAPFAGEHGWFWLNISEKPVTITLQFTGYHREVKDYGLIQ